MRRLQSATAGAGLAVAFNAPLGGTLFTFEEVASSFSEALSSSTLIARATAIGVSRLL
jgi:CIC family chloride channel protein